MSEQDAVMMSQENEAAAVQEQRENAMEVGEEQIDSVEVDENEVEDNAGEENNADISKDVLVGDLQGPEAIGENVIGRGDFMKFVHDIVRKELGAKDVRFQKSALVTLQEAAEEYIMSVFTNAQKLSEFRGSNTVTLEDFMMLDNLVKSGLGNLPKQILAEPIAEEAGEEAQPEVSAAVDAKENAAGEA